MIIKDIDKLKEPCEEVKDYEQAETIAASLLKELTNSKSGIGLAANQIGIDTRVCVVNVKEPFVLINPKIVDKSEETFVFPEGCLSFPNKKIYFIAKINNINDEKLREFDEALNKVLLNLAKRVVSDGEGASKFITINVQNCKNENDAKLAS